MKQDNTNPMRLTSIGSSTQSPAPDTPSDVLTDILRKGAQQLLAQAIEAEVADYIGGWARGMVNPSPSSHFN